MLLIIDRIESGIAVCEDLETEQQYKFKAAELPSGAREGDALDYDGTTLTRNAQKTAERTAAMKNLMDEVFE